MWIEQEPRPNLRPADVRRLADLSADARVLVGGFENGGWYVWAEDADGHACRYAFYPAIGRVTVNWLAAPFEKPGSGWGAKKFLRLARTWRDAGFAEVYLPAADGNHRSRLYTGYYVWPRFGFAATMSAAQHARLPAAFRGTRDVQALFARKGGPLVWRKYGGRLWHLTFDLRPGSDSWRLFEEYLRGNP